MKSRKWSRLSRMNDEIEEMTIIQGMIAIIPGMNDEIEEISAMWWCICGLMKSREWSQLSWRWMMNSRKMSALNTQWDHVRIDDESEQMSAIAQGLMTKSRIWSRLSRGLTVSRLLSILSESQIWSSFHWKCCNFWTKIEMSAFVQGFIMPSRNDRDYPEE